MEYAITIKHPAKIVNVYIQDDQTPIAAKIAPLCSDMMRKKHHMQKQASSRGSLPDARRLKNTGLDAETAPFDLVVNFKRKEGMAIANAATAP
jgi:hypothetical protein